MLKMQFKTKMLLLTGVVLTSGVAVLSYVAGTQSQWLNADAISFSHLQSNQHSNQLTSSMWNTLLTKLSTRARNHEQRLGAYAQVA